MHRACLIFILVLTVFINLNAQIASSGAAISVEGFISNKEGKNIENVHVVNISGSKGTTSDREGQFRISALPGDTIRFTCVGYNPYKYHIPADRLTPVLPLHIVMLMDTIQISGVTIYPWPADVKALKEAILAMEDQTPRVPDLKLNDPRYTAGSLPNGNPKATIPGMADPGLTMSIPGPITALYDAFSKAAKSQRKYESLVKDDQKKVVAARRYNPEVVKQVTSFKSDKEIQDFMMYCNLSVDFIVSSSEYELYKAIHECLLAYNAEKKDKI
jgi:hypothetical protein